MMINRVTVRPVEVEDAQTLQQNCFPMNKQEDIRTHIKENMSGFEEGMKLHVVAEFQNEIVGTALLSRNEHPLHHHRAEVFSLVVQEQHHEKGIARKLLDALLNHAKIWNLSILDISTRAGTVAEKVFPKLGFIKFGYLPKGIRESWGENNEYDQVYYYYPVESESLP